MTPFPPQASQRRRAPRLGRLFILAALAATVPGAARAEDENAGQPSTVLSSYGEINYNRPRTPADARIDLRRFVIGLEHRFDERTKFGGELEVEHAVSSATDPGEVEIEQAWVERQLSSVWSVRGGLFLLPVGLLNENHEPTAYHGVERNFVETAIIPTTWREGGVQAVAVFGPGLTVQAGITTSFDLSKWDATSPEGLESPLGAVHQELALARAKDFAGHLAVNWRGVPGLQVGAAGFAGGAGQGATDGAHPVVALWDVHTRWTPWRLDLSALYARGTISDTAKLNAPLVGQPVLVPAAFDGWYAQAAIRAASFHDLVLTPFVRYERFNTGREYADLGPGRTPAPLPTQAVLTVGADLAVGSGVVLKADLQKFTQDRTLDRLDLGLGWSF
jgi:hypothetical protein